MISRGRLLVVLAGAALAFGVGGLSASAGPPSPADPAGGELGIVPVHGNAGDAGNSGDAGNARPQPGGGNNLVYHNGPVMRTNAVYAIYWVPNGFTVSANYASVLNGFFQNVAADNGKQSNVYWSDTQYYDTTGAIASSSSYAASVVDTNAFPASGCSDPYTAVCLTDSQLRTEIDGVVSANGWPRGTGSVYFIFTPRNVGSCYGSSCAFTYFCAYHSWFGSGSSVTLYANMPYAAWVPSACGSGQSPNGDDADSTINVTSHEHNESITDPLGSAWYDRRGYENGDKCGWNFGTSLGSTGSGKYNQVIGTGTYYLQQEWSNARSGCVLTGT
jgi:hypothetical protein